MTSFKSPLPDASIFHTDPLSQPCPVCFNYIFLESPPTGAFAGIFKIALLRSPGYKGIVEKGLTQTFLKLVYVEHSKSGCYADWITRNATERHTAKSKHFDRSNYMTGLFNGRSNPEVVGSIPTEVKRNFSLPRVVPRFPLLGLTPSGSFMGFS